jgi:hypothetical protein
MNKTDLLFLLWGIYNMACSHDGTTPVYESPSVFITKYSFLYDSFQEAIQSEALKEFKDDINSI